MFTQTLKPGAKLDQAYRAVKLILWKGIALNSKCVTLPGTHIRLEPLEHRHASGLADASAEDPPLYEWSPVPQGAAATAGYIDTALSWQDAGAAMPFAIVRTDNNLVIGSTRFWNLERWAWPAGHIRHGRNAPDACSTA